MTSIQTYLLAAFLGAACIAVIFRVWRELKEPSWFSATLWGALFLILGESLWSVGSGRAIAAVGLAMPGSFATQIWSPTTDPFLRRAIEPFFWSLIGLSFVLRLSLARRLVSILLIVEVLGMSFGRGAHNNAFLLLGFIQFALTLGFVTEILRSSLEQSDSSIQTQIQKGTVIEIAALFAVLVFEVISIPVYAQRQSGAHYYSWFPENWPHGYAAAKLVPPAGPLLGEYSMRELDTVRQHVLWAKEAGLDFFVIDWWPSRQRLRRRIEIYTDPAQRAFDEMHFAIQYETIDLKRGRSLPGEAENLVELNDERREQLVQDWLYLAERHLKNPRYLRINGRPVLFIYATRHLTGDVASVFRAARAAVREKTGEELYLVGDEVFYNVIVGGLGETPRLLAEGSPAWERVAEFDAITAYNPYETFRPQYGGIEGAELFLRDVAKLYDRYSRVAATANVDFIPTVLPSYNDRGVRKPLNHYVVPDRFGAPERSFLSEALTRWVRPYSAPFYTVTSWNEWNEGTSVEPSSLSEATTEDSSESTLGYTTGQFLEGYGCRRLEELREFNKPPGSDSIVAD